MRVAVVILNWNGKSFLEQFLPNVTENSAEATVYVADNASTDGSVEFVKENHSNVKIIETGGNHGYAGGYNKALEHLDEDIFVLLNSDVEVTHNWIAPILELFDKEESVAACQPKILEHANKTKFEYAGAAGGFIDKFGFPFCRGRLFETIEEDTGQYDDTREIFWASGACMFVRSKIYKELGGLDGDFFAHMEEIDFCWRAKRRGYKIMFEPSCRVYHVGGGTLSKSNPWKTFLNFRNGLELLAKNLPSGKLVPMLFIRMIFDGVAAWKFLLSGQRKDFWAVFKAHLAFYGRIRKTLNKRVGDFTEVNEAYRKSIVLDYFLRGKKKFSELDPDKF